METVQLKHCPICTKDLPVSEFGRNVYYNNRGAKDGRSLYCKSCVRLKRKDERKKLKEYKAAKKIRVARKAEVAASINYDPLFDKQWPIGCSFKLSPVDRVRVAIQKGCRTQKEIAQETKLTKDEIGDAIAELLLWSGQIKTQVVNDTRLYFLNEKEDKPKAICKPAIPFAELIRKANPNEFLELKVTERAA